MGGGCQARSKIVIDKRRSPEAAVPQGFVGSNPTPRTLNVEMDESAKTGLLLNIEIPFMRVIARNVIVLLINTSSIQVHLQYGFL
jgi:hypothetical protein